MIQVFLEPALQYITIVLHISVALNLLALGLIYWLNLKIKDQEMNTGLLESELEGAKHAYEALISDLNNYQVKTDRKISDTEKHITTKMGSNYREIDKLKKELPTTIRNVIGHIEFAKPVDNTFTPKYKK